MPKVHRRPPCSSSTLRAPSSATGLTLFADTAWVSELCLCVCLCVCRFLRSVCMFHTQSEEDVMFPEVLRISSGTRGPEQEQLDTVLAACTTCQDEHTSEVSAAVWGANVGRGGAGGAQSSGVLYSLARRLDHCSLGTSGAAHT